ncbi:hypothetical protein [Streptomyces sp. NPDC058374]|uniref:hypothetical protein n=1 Tax=Streptomyces sp. NPDC058374 TaxID=3346466 RepID=UPI00365A4731
MTTFLRARCDAPLTPDLRLLPEVPDATRDKDRDRATGLAPSAVPRGHHARDPEQWGAPFAPARAPTAAGPPTAAPSSSRPRWWTMSPPAPATP